MENSIKLATINIDDYFDPVQVENILTDYIQFAGVFLAKGLETVWTS